MRSKVELYNGTYGNYAEDVYKAIRKETFGEDIGQNSWITADEYRDFFSILKLSPGKKVLEIATGSGGPAVFLVKETGCTLTGIDINENGILNAGKLAAESGLNEQIEFIKADASEGLPFADGSFDAVISMDSINHIRNRGKLLLECRRKLKPGGMLLYTDPIVVTGILTNEEIAVRSSIGYFLFVPLGENERLLKEAGFAKIASKDVTENIARVSGKWYEARRKRKEELGRLEDENTYEGLQSFFKMVNTLSSERRLSRILYTAVK